MARINWTQYQRDIAKQLDEGKTPEEIIASGLGKDSVSKVAYALQKGERPPTKPVKDNGHGSGEKKTKEDEGGKTPVVVGRITITPENWGMTQEGAILIIDTYNKAKRDIDYTGTIGDFIRDMCEFYRRVMNYNKEVVYGGERSQGGDGAKENGTTGAGAGRQLARG